jgi:phosphate transport system substrate-binding protein
MRLATHFSLSSALVAAALVLAGCGGSNAPAEQTASEPTKAEVRLTGAGSTFVYPVMSRWAAEYQRIEGAQVNYQSIGSGGGIAQVKAGTVDFGASDKPLSSAELDEAGLMQFPIVIGGVVPVVNLAGVQPGALRLTGPLLSDIYLGKVQRWNDPALQALNPELGLPDEEIQVVYRSDGSGTTFNLSHYLGQVSAEWAEQVGTGTALSWPRGVGGRGNEGVAAFIQQLPNSIGYVELSYALQTGATYTALRNAAGEFVQPSAESFAAAAASADWAKAQDFNLLITNAEGANAWPIAASVFILLPENAPQREAALAFFEWALESGQPMARELDYVPLPPELVSLVKLQWTPATAAN